MNRLANLSNERWTEILDARSKGQLTPKQDSELQLALSAGRVPKELIKGTDKDQSTLRAATPEEVQTGSNILDPSSDSWGQTALQVGIPLIAGIATGGNPVAVGGAAAHLATHAHD